MPKKKNDDNHDIKQQRTDCGASAGYVEVGRVSTLIRATGETPNEAKVAEIAKAASENGGRITVDGLMDIVSELRKSKDGQRPSVNDVEAAFRVFDPSGKGYLTKDELKRVLTNFGDKLSAKEVEELFKVGDVDEHGRIDYVRLANKLDS